MNRAGDRATGEAGAVGAPGSGSGNVPRSNGGNAGQAGRLRSDTLRWLIVAALLVRAALSVADAAGIAGGGVQPLPLGSALAVSASSPFWPLLWAALSLAGGVGLAYRSTAGWVVAGAACLGYLAAGIGDLSLLDTSASVGDPGFWLVFLADLVVPAAVLVGLYQLRSGYVRAASRPHLARRAKRPRA